MATILVAEDEPALLESYRDLVTTLGHKCLAASDGDEALELARKEHPDLVLTDYMMPGRTGVELIGALKSDPVLDRVPVILVSAARPPRRELEQAFRFFSKPLNMADVEEAIAAGLCAAREVGPPGGFRPVPSGAVSPVSLAREDMLSWVAHEIKTPLSAAFAAAELALRAGGFPDGQERRLHTIKRQLTRMNELVNAVLDAAQLQDGRLEVKLEPADLGEIIEGAVAYFRDLNADVRFSLEESEPVEIEADPQRLRQIVDNLLSNAVKYGGPANEVRVMVTATERNAVVTVSDRGPGIPKEQIGHIFDRFHRVPGSGGRGHGLGLYIAAALARLLGGEITVTSVIGDGSTFRLTLPRAFRDRPG
jgi:two-component system, sensor histidine kinase and response regulator